MDLKRTPLFETHKALGARMVEFGGWEMPVQYSGILEEHRAVRTAAGLFDIDHMGQVIVEGPDALPFLQYIMSADVGSFAPNSANYSLMCYDDGGVVDDEHVFVVVPVGALGEIEGAHHHHLLVGDEDFDVQVVPVAVQAHLQPGGREGVPESA